MAQAVKTTWVAHEEDMAKAILSDRRAFWRTTGAYIIGTVGVLVLTLI